MDSTSRMGQLRELADELAGHDSPRLVVEAGLPTLLSITGAAAALVLAPRHDVSFGPAQAGLHLDATASIEVPPGGGSFIACETPETWRSRGVVEVGIHHLPDGLGTLVLAWTAPAPEDASTLDLALGILDLALTRGRFQAQYDDLIARVESAQQLAQMGDYDWHIPSDVSTWSDQLFRIYGYEPQSFQPSYDKFISLLHPEDRDWVSALHQQAYATGEPYQMVERIVRPDGRVRFLSSTGEVIRDADGQPVRLRGTCIDITEQVLAERERERSAARFQGLVDAAPDAILLLGADHCVLEANHRAHQLLGGDPRGRSIEAFIPGWPGSGSAGVSAVSLDGAPLQLDVITSGVDSTAGSDPGGSLVALFLRDARPRLDGESVVARLDEAQLRRRQALEINDNVVQGLVAAVYALEVGESEASLSYLERTLTAARAMMDDLLDPLDGAGLQPGDLVRTAAATLGTDFDPELDGRAPVPQLPRTHSVLVVDDADDLRLLLRTRMESCRGLTVVGEAADGIAAVEMAAELQPDLVLLDLAMPRMDGLEALPLIRAAVPGVRVIVLSGFNQSTLAQKALEAGADHYVVKGGSMTRLLELVDSLLQPAS